MIDYIVKIVEENHVIINIFKLKKYKKIIFKKN